MTSSISRLKSRLADLEDRLAIARARRDGFSAVEASLHDELEAVRAELMIATRRRFATSNEIT